jgi:hypothetical protein
MKIAVILVSLLLTACSVSVPVKQRFPTMPPELQKPCADLTSIETKTVTLSQMIDVVVTNYGTYYECQAHNRAIVDWYGKQKQIFDELNKN